MAIGSRGGNVVKSGTMAKLPEWASLTIEEAAAQSNYHPESLRRLCRQKKIVSVKVGQILLIKKASLDDYIEAHKTGPDAWRFGPKKRD